MKKIILMAILLILNSACSNKDEKPKVTEEQFYKQSMVITGVVNKILSQEDPKIMFKMADAIESARAVDCIPVAEECNAYYKVVNKVVNVTKDGKLSDENKILLYKMFQELNNEIAKSLKINLDNWKNYKASHPDEFKAVNEVKPSH